MLQVDAINNDPSLAQDVDRDCGAFNPAIFRHLLPVCSDNSSSRVQTRLT